MPFTSLLFFRSIFFSRPIRGIPKTGSFDSEARIEHLHSFMDPGFPVFLYHPVNRMFQSISFYSLRSCFINGPGRRLPLLQAVR
jgi:hypothetical protein